MPRGPDPEFSCQGWCSFLHPDKKRPQRRLKRLLAGLRGWGIGNLNRADRHDGGVGWGTLGRASCLPLSVSESGADPGGPNLEKLTGKSKRSEVMTLPLGSALAWPPSTPTQS